MPSESLYREMESQEITSPAPAEGDEPRPGLFGRERELARLEALFADARDSHSGRVGLVTGEPGIGKSRLLDELALRLRAAGVLVLEARCHDAQAGARAYGPIAALIEAAAFACEPLRDRASELVETLAGRGHAGERRTASERGSWELRRVALFEEVASFLTDVSRLAPIGIVLHHLELADGATRGMVAHLAQTRTSAPELSLSGERLWGLFAISSRDTDGSWLLGAAAERLELAPLDLGGVRAFLQSPEVVAFFAEATGGRPRALEALIESRPAGADEIFRARLSRLSPDARAALGALSVLGRPASPDELRRVSGMTELVARPRVASELIEARLASKLVVDGELRLAFARSADEETTYRELEPATRLALHAAAGRLYAEAGADPLAVAEHLLRGAAGEEAVDAAILAGERLEITYGYDRAIDLYRRAWATTTRDDVRELLETRLCELLRLVGDYSQALEHAERLRRRLPDAASFRRIAQLHVLSDEIALALAALDEAWTLAGPGPRGEVERARVRAARAEAYFLGGRLDDAKAECVAVLEHSGDDGETLALRLEVQNTLGKVLLGEADYAGASEIFAANLEQARTLGRAFEESRALYNLGIAQLRLGDAGGASARYQAALKVAEAAGDHRNRAFCLQNLGVLAHWRNDYATALAYFHDAVTAFKTIGQRARLAWLALDLASVYLDLGEVERARAMAELAERFGCAQPAAVAIEHQLTLGRVAARAGDTAAAETHFETALARANESHDQEPRVDALLALTRLDLDRGEVASGGRRLAELGTLASETTRARVLLLAGELELLRGSPAEARKRLLEAVERFHHVGGLEGEWRAHYWLGRVAEARGDAPEAERRFRVALAVDARVRERVPEAHRAAHADEPLRRALEKALGLSRVVPLLPEGAGERRGPRLAPATERGERSERKRGSAELARPPAAERASEPRYPKLVGRHPKLQQIFSLLDKLAPADSLVLIRGESGTGKELIADALHSHSPRQGRPFVKVNCGALVETLLLSELFGHERGAFTGAFQRKKGRFEAAQGGTLFLDEIGDISPKTQVALLRVLQEREITRVGGNTNIKVDVRILCATNRNLEQMVTRGEFREDLYYRLKGIQIELPALRERAGDIPLLAEAFLERARTERGPAEPKKEVAPDALKLLMSYAWPGNVRELENVLRSVSLFADGDVIGVQDFADYSEIFKRSGSVRVPEPELVTPASPSAWSRLAEEKLSLKALKTRIEVECITRALDEAHGNITKAAEILGMKRPRLSQLIKQHRITSAQPGDKGGSR